jgi:predicted glycoside hydrolase/deacetylase ChbG (UPF0249 family)
MRTKRQLIVNADDFGRSPGVNQGIIEAHESGIVTSASMMVRWPSATEAAAYGQAHPALSLGLHFDLGEWAFQGGDWVSVYEVASTDDVTAVAEEVTRQLAIFHCLMGRDPTHLDSHQHVHRQEPVHSVLVGIARKLAVPLRHYCPSVSYCGNFYGQTAQGLPRPDAISVDRLLGILSALPPGITELACHPGVGNDLVTGYREERANEVKALCDPRVRAAIGPEKIELWSFGNVALRRLDLTQ